MNKAGVVTMSIEESGLGRWSRLKKARKDRAAKGRAIVAPQISGGRKGTRGKAVPTAIPTEVSGDYRPWLPPLTADTAGTLPEVSGDGVSETGEITSDDRLNDEEKIIAEEMNLPDIDTLEEESDYRAFMTDGVPDKLRRLALRKLWATNPLFGIRDGLNDYDEDFRALSDYVYNAVAMKRFTEPDSMEEADVAENGAEDTDAADGTEELEASEAGSDTDTEQSEVEKTTEPEISSESPSEPAGESPGDPLIENDDQERG